MPSLLMVLPNCKSLDALFNHLNLSFLIIKKKIDAIMSRVFLQFFGSLNRKGGQRKKKKLHNLAGNEFSFFFPFVSLLSLPLLLKINTVASALTMCVAI